MIFLYSKPMNVLTSNTRRKEEEIGRLLRPTVSTSAKNTQALKLLNGRLPGNRVKIINQMRECNTW